MEEHEEISACYHNAISWTQNDDKVELSVNNQPSGYISDEDIICTTKGWYPTASLFMRTEYIKEQPLLPLSTGDEGWRNYLACRGKLYFLNRVWSVYRCFSTGGWNTRYYADEAFALRYFKNVILYFHEFNKYSQGRFEKYIKKRLFYGIIKFQDAHYGLKCSVNELRACLSALKNVTEHRIDFVLDEYYSLKVIECRDYYPLTVKEQLETNDELYIYGTGAEAVKALMELAKNNISPKGFIVSNKQGLPSDLIGIPIYGAEEFVFHENMRIWPCLINGRENVLKILHDNKCKSIVF